MIVISLFIGIIAYSIFIIGILHALTPINIGLITLVGLTLLIILIIKTWPKKLSIISLSHFEKVMILILILEIVITLIGVMGPEVAFDSLWYHLTLPKLYMQMQAIEHVPGSLFYYSEMPKLTEMLYIPSLLFFNERAAKFIHFLFGEKNPHRTFRISDIQSSRHNHRFIFTNTVYFINHLFYTVA